VRNEDDGGSGCAQVAEAYEQGLGLGRGEGGGRLVQDQEASLSGEGAGDLDLLLLGSREIARDCGGIDRGADPRQDGARLA
jgi:hypothetical protein